MFTCISRKFLTEFKHTLCIYCNVQGQSEKVIRIEIKNNAVAAESDKTFRVKLIGDTDKAFTQEPIEAIVTITDDDGKFLRAKYHPSLRLDLFVENVSSLRKTQKWVFNWHTRQLQQLLDQEDRISFV